MTEEQNKQEEVKKEEAKVEETKVEETVAETPAAEASAEAKTEAPATEAKAEEANPPAADKQPRGARGGKKPFDKKKGGKRKSRAAEEQQSEYIEKVVQVRRVTKVVKGGKKLSFRTTVIIGNEKGKVGVGVGKASEVLTAIKKAISDARKNLVDVDTVANTNTISHSVYGIAGGSRVLLRPAAEGTGIIAGGTARIVLELAGVGDILAKSQGSKSPLNVARATLNALKQIRSFQEVANLRGISVKKMLFA